MIFFLAGKCKRFFMQCYIYFTNSPSVYPQSIILGRALAWTTAISNLVCTPTKLFPVLLLECPVVWRLVLSVHDICLFESLDCVLLNTLHFASHASTESASLNFTLRSSQDKNYAKKTQTNKHGKPCFITEILGHFVLKVFFSSVSRKRTRLKAH